MTGRSCVVSGALRGWPWRLQLHHLVPPAALTHQQPQAHADHTQEVTGEHAAGRVIRGDRLRDKPAWPMGRWLYQHCVDVVDRSHRGGGRHDAVSTPVAQAHHAPAGPGKRECRESRPPGSLPPAPQLPLGSRHLCLWRQGALRSVPRESVLPGGNGGAKGAAYATG
jgi:hypothetical protein